MTDVKTIPIPATEFTKLQRDLGYAQGLLRGWMMHDDDNLELCRTVTRQFLERDDND